MASSSPSVTAAVVASTLLLLRDDDELGHLVDAEALPPIESAVRAALPILGTTLDHVPWPLLKRLARGVERAVSPGFVAHYALRKHAIRRHLLAAVADGFEQVVLVGAGFDMMSRAVPERVRVFEVDHPGTQRMKRDGLRASSTRDVTFVPADLTTTSLPDALAEASFDPSRDTVFVAEGVLMYLARPRAEAVLGEMVDARRRTRAIVTLVTPDRRGRPRLHSQRAVVDRCMRFLDEPFVWGERRPRVGALLARQGLRLESIASTDELRDAALSVRARRRLPRATGELIVLASAAPTG